MKKRIISLLLAVLLVVGLAPAAGAFSDVDDAQLASQIELLSELGIIDGYTDGTFRPNQPLTRAEFTKLVVTMLGREDDRALYAGYTIFTDVVSGHWAAGYINLAARAVDKGGLALVKGYKDGSFKPDATITYGEAVTIVLRALGYADADIGYNWPQDYVDKAAQSGLGDGVNLGKDDIVGRADGARIFYNALFVENKEGKKLIDSVYGEVIESALIMSVDESGVGIHGEEEKLVNAAGLTADAVGKRYKLTLWSDGERIMLAEEVTQRFTTVERAAITSVEVVDGVTLVNYDSVVDAVSLASIDESWEKRDAELKLDRTAGVILEATMLEHTDGTHVTIEFAYYSGDEVTAVSGEVVEIPADTVVYTTDKGTDGDSEKFSDLRDHLSYGDRLELVYDDEDGKLLYVLTIVGEASVEVLEAGETQSEVFAALGAPGGTKIYKNEVEVGFSDLVIYDVLSYSKGGAINVSDFRLNAMYTYAMPNSAAPTAITVFGSSVKLAPCARESVAKFEPLERMTLLFAVDGRIAGAIAPTNERRVGVYTGSSVQFLGGPEIAMTIADAEAGALVNVALDAKGNAVGHSVRGQSTGSALDLESGSIGGAKLALGCVFYETAAEGAAPVRIDREDILAPTVAAEDILHVGYNSSGQATVVILGDVTGDTYTYGRVSRSNETRTATGQVLSYSYVADVISVTGAGEKKADAVQTMQIPDALKVSASGLSPRYVWGGIVVGDAKSPAGGTAEQVVAIKLLEESHEIGRADFDGSTAVVVDGVTMPIADGVLVWLDSTDVFMTAGKGETQLQLVSAARAQSDSFEVLVSEGKVRVIIVK